MLWDVNSSSLYLFTTLPSFSSALHYQLPCHILSYTAPVSAFNGSICTASLDWSRQECFQRLQIRLDSSSSVFFAAKDAEHLSNHHWNLKTHLQIPSNLHYSLMKVDGIRRRSVCDYLWFTTTTWRGRKLQHHHHTSRHPVSPHHNTRNQKDEERSNSSSGHKRE